jgi:hypothetical protein
MRKNEGVQSSSHIIGIDASRAARAKRTGTETYSLELIKAREPNAPAPKPIRWS